MKKISLLFFCFTLCLTLLGCDKNDSTSETQTIEEPYYFDMIDFIWSNYVIEAYLINEVSIDNIENITFVGFRYDLEDFPFENQIRDQTDMSMMLFVDFNDNANVKDHVFRCNFFEFGDEYFYMHQSDNLSDSINDYRLSMQNEYNLRLNYINESKNENSKVSYDFIDETFIFNDLLPYIPEVNLYEENNIIYQLLDDYAILVAPNDSFDPNLGEFTIPKFVDDVEVKEIRSTAFIDTQLTSVVIPDSITRIGQRAFYENNLTSVVIPDSVTRIGAFSFYGNDLTYLIIPDGLTHIKFNAFYGNNLTSVIIPDSVTTIESYAFYGNSLTDVIIPDSVTTIGDEAFRSNNFISITIMGDELRFNETWENIGFPEELKPA